MASRVYNPGMKFKNWFTPAGSIVLFVSAIFHSSGYKWLLKTMHSAGITSPIDTLLKALWWGLSVEFVGLGIIVLLAHRMEYGGHKQGARIVLLCAVISAVSAVLFLCFMGPFPGVYLLTLVTVLLLIGGVTQTRSKPAA
jgi:hypothetical protein